MSLLRFLDGMLGRRKLTLADLREPAHIHVLGRVASPNGLQSPVSPVKAAVFTWALLHQEVIVNRQNDTRGVRLKRFAGGILGDELLVETDHGSVAVPLSLARIDYLTPIDRNAQPLMTRPPPPLAQALADDKRYQEVFYGERFLNHGDRVALRCSVDPRSASGGKGAYRGGATGADFHAIGDRADITELG